MASNIYMKIQDGVTNYLGALVEAKGVSTIIHCNSDHVADASSENGVIIEGCSENDSITGSPSSDIINGKGGINTVDGGAGSDIYEIDSEDWINGRNIITDTAGDNDSIQINTTSDKIHFFFNVEQNGVVTNGNVGYTKGNDLYINSSNDYTLDNATTSNGVKIVNYFSAADSVENIVIPNGNQWSSAIGNNVIDIIGQSVANWLKNHDFASTQDAITNLEDDVLKAELLNLYNPIIGGADTVTGTAGDDVIIASDLTQELQGGAGSDTLYGGAKTTVYLTGSGDNVIYASDGPQGYGLWAYLGSGNDTIYGPETRELDINLRNNNSYGSGLSNMGDNTFFYRGGGIRLLCDSENISVDDMIFSKPAETNDLVLRYGDGSFMIKDYYLYNEANPYNFMMQYYDGGTQSDTLDDIITQTGGLAASAAINHEVAGWLASPGIDNSIADMLIENNSDDLNSLIVQFSN